MLILYNQYISQLYRLKFSRLEQICIFPVDIALSRPTLANIQ
jgi:hypothetical protein